MPKLVISKGSEKVREHTISVDIVAFTVGSEQGNDIVIKDPKVSMLHLQFEREGNSYYVRDLRSATGTFLNGERVETRAKVNDGDIIEVGEHRILFQNTPTSEPVPQIPSRVPETQAFPEDLAADSNGDQNGRSETISELAEARQHSVEALIESDVESSESRAGSTPQTSTVPDPFDLFFSAPDSEDLDQTPKTSARETKRTQYYLLAIYGPYLGKRYPLNFGETKIGRDTALNDIVVRENEQGEIDTSISRRHATITYRDGDYYLTDKRSKTRTYVNQREVTPEDEVRLRPGDEIEIVSDQKSSIFRFVPEGDWDFRTPRQAGVWWVRYRAAFAALASILTLLASVLIFYEAWTYRQIVAAVPDTVELDESLWYADPAAPPSSAASSILPELAVADLDGDKAADLVMADANGVVKAISGADRAILWTVSDFDANSVIPATLADLNRDDRPDVIVTSIDGRIRAIDGRLGVEIWTSPILGGLFSGAPVVTDFNADGYADVVVTTTEGVIHIGLGSLTEPTWRKTTFGTLSHATATAEDLSGNGLPELLVGTETGKVIVYSGARNQVLGSIDVNEEIAKAWGVAGSPNPVRTAVVSGDFDGDGTLDFIVATDEGNVLAMDGNSLQRLWGERIGRPSEPIWNAYAVRVADLDGDGRSDALIAVRDGRLRAIKTNTQTTGRREVLWEYESPPGTQLVNSPALVDFNKNGTQDVVLATTRGSVEILEGSTGTTISAWTENTLPIVAGPVIADMDGDSYLDILIGRSDGRFYQITTNRRVLRGSVVWGQTAGGPQHTGRLTYADPSAATAGWTMFGSAGVALATILLNVTAYRRRRSLTEGH
jgi:pSer/pThr/pTyr-binding forkhead associated (FHA) protein